MSKNKYAAKREFYKTIQDLAEHPVVLEMKKYPQHGKTNCYKHCLRARAGMIHDLFLYDWHTHAAQTGERFHGLKHPEKAYRNAKKYFPLNQIEIDIIRTHMWPVTFRTFPRTREGWVTTLTDKYCSLLETGRRK